ncbi:MAG: tetratricopeptide repeat protein [Polyangiales bacterium]
MHEAEGPVEVPAPSAEDFLAIMMGQWTDEQALEFEAYDDSVFDAFIAIHEERYENARTLFQSALDNAEAPVYLYKELGTASMLSNEPTAATEAFETFLSRLPDGSDPDARLTVHIALAQLAQANDQPEAAIAQFENAIDAMPNDYRPYLALGSYLRTTDHPDQALEVLRSALTVTRTTEPDWQLTLELGLVYRDLQRTDDAINALDQVLEFFKSRGVYEFPGAVTKSLAELYAESGQTEQSASMYRLFLEQYDGAESARMHLELGRQLVNLGLNDEARTALQRAVALKPDPDTKRSAETLLVELG